MEKARRHGVVGRSLDNQASSSLDIESFYDLFDRFDLVHAIDDVAVDFDVRRRLAILALEVEVFKAIL